MYHERFYFTFLAAVYTYYRSLNQEESLRRRGKQDDRKRTRRRRERLLRVCVAFLSVHGQICVAHTLFPSCIVAMAMVVVGGIFVKALLDFVCCYGSAYIRTKCHSQSYTLLSALFMLVKVIYCLRLCCCITNLYCCHGDGGRHVYSVMVIRTTVSTLSWLLPEAICCC